MITGSLLKEKRKSLNLSCLEVASRSCLSLNQVKALESDDISPFYNIQIRQLCLKRVAQVLDLEQQHFADNDIVSNLQQESLLNISAPPELSTARYLNEKLFAMVHKSRKFIFNTVILIVVLMTINYQLKTSQNELVQANEKIEISTPITSQAETKPLANEIPTSEINKSCTKGDNLLDTTVEFPIKPPNKVYFISATPQKICLSDANGQINYFNLSANGSNIFFGTPPFIVAAENFDSLSLFFQGKKVNLNGVQKTAIQLNASPLS